MSMTPLPPNPHRAPVSAVAIVDHAHVASAGYDGRVILWGCDGERLVPTRDWTVADKNLNAIASSACGRWVAAGSSSGVVALIDLGTDEVTELRHEGDVECLAFCPLGGRLASGGTDGDARVFDLGTGRCTVLEHGRTVGALVFDEGARLLTVCNDGALRVHGQDLALVETRVLSDLPLKSIALGADGDVLVGGHDAVLRRVALGRESAVPLMRLASTPKALASHGAWIALGGYDGQLRAGRRVDELETLCTSGRTWAHSVAVRDELVAAGSFDGAPRVWRRRAEGWVQLRSDDARVPCISAVAVCHEGVVTAGDAGLVRVHGGRELACLDEAVTAVRGGPGGVIAATWSGRVHLRVGDPGAVVVRVSASPLVCAEVDGDDLVVGMYTGGVACLDARTGEERWRSEDATGAVKSVDLCGGHVAVVGRYDGLRVLDRATGHTIARLRLETSVSDVVRFSPDGRLLAAAGGPHEVWMVGLDAEGRSLEVICRSPGHRRPIKALLWLESGALLAGDYDGRILLHTRDGLAREIARLSPRLGVSGLVRDGVDVVATTFDGDLRRLPPSTWNG